MLTIIKYTFVCKLLLVNDEIIEWFDDFLMKKNDIMIHSTLSNEKHTRNEIIFSNDLSSAVFHFHYVLYQSNEDYFSICIHVWKKKKDII